MTRSRVERTNGGGLDTFFTSFATWISNKIVDQWHPEWDGQVSRVQGKNGVMGSDSLVSARRIRQPIESKHDIANAFDGITYQKGASVIRMFESWVGEKKFQSGVTAYLKRYSYKNARVSDFLDAIANLPRFDFCAHELRILCAVEVTHFLRA